MGKRLKRHSGVGGGVTGKIAILDFTDTLVVAGVTEKQRLDELFRTFSQCANCFRQVKKQRGYNAKVTPD